MVTEAAAAAPPILASTLYNTLHNHSSPSASRKRLHTGVKAIDEDVLQGGLNYGDGGIVSICCERDSDVAGLLFRHLLTSHLLPAPPKSTPTSNPQHPDPQPHQRQPTNHAFFITTPTSFSAPSLLHHFRQHLRNRHHNTHPTFTHTGGYTYSRRRPTSDTHAPDADADRDANTAPKDKGEEVERQIETEAMGALDRISVLRVLDFEGVLEAVGEIAGVLAKGGSSGMSDEVPASILEEGREQEEGRNMEQKQEKDGGREQESESEEQQEEAATSSSSSPSANSNRKRKRKRDIELPSSQSPSISPTPSPPPPPPSRPPSLPRPRQRPQQHPNPPPTHSHYPHPPPHALHDAPHNSPRAPPLAPSPTRPPIQTRTSPPNQTTTSLNLNLNLIILPTLLPLLNPSPPHHTRPSHVSQVSHVQVRAQALLTHLLRNLRHLTARYNVCVVLGDVLVPCYGDDEYGGSGSRGREGQGRDGGVGGGGGGKSAFEALQLTPAMSRSSGNGAAVDLTLSIWSIDRWLEPQREHQSPAGETEKTSDEEAAAYAVECLKDSRGARAGRWCVWRT